MISEPKLCLVQTMHLSCTDTNTVSKRKETRFQMTHINYEFHRVRPKWCSSLSYIRRKLCTYLASWLALSPNGLKQASTWASSHRRTIGALKMMSKPVVCLAQTVHLSCTNTSTASKQTEMKFHMTHITLEFHRMRPKWFLSLWYIWRKLCAYLASWLALSPNRPKQDYTSASWLEVPSGVS